MGSSFLYTRAADGGDAPAWLGRWTAWGQTAETRFDGADGPLSVHGEVATATVGVDTRRDRWLAGVAVSYSLGDGAYTQAQAGVGTLASHPGECLAVRALRTERAHQPLGRVSGMERAA